MFTVLPKYPVDGPYIFWTMRTLSQSDGNYLFLHHFIAAWLAPHIKKSTKYVTKHIPIWVHGHHPPITFKNASQPHLGRGHNNDGDTTTAGNEGIFAFPNASGRGQPFPFLYLPFCVGDGPLSNTSCRPGALIVSCLCTENGRQDAIGLCQCYCGGCIYFFWKN